MIIVDVNKQSVFVKNPLVVGESRKYLKVKFSFTEDWESYGKTAIFKCADGTAIQVVLNENSTLFAEEDTYFVPFEVIKAPFFSIALQGEKDESRITTESVRVSVAESGVEEGDAPSEPTPDVYSQLISISEETLKEAKKSSVYAEQAAQSAQAAKESEQSTLEARLALEEGAEWIFDGGNAYVTVNEIPENIEYTTNKTTELTAQSTDEQYPSAKAVYDGLNSKIGKTGKQIIQDGSICIEDTDNSSDCFFAHKRTIDGTEHQASFFVDSAGNTAITQRENGKETSRFSLGESGKPLSVLNGGTGAKTVAEARVNLGLQNISILGTSNYQMGDSETVTLTENFSNISTGIVLIFAFVNNSGAANYGYQTFFVPKQAIDELGGGFTFPLIYNLFQYVGNKYLYINKVGDTITISGCANNTASGTAATGITYNNDRFVLKRVIGV